MTTFHRRVLLSVGLLASLAFVATTFALGFGLGARTPPAAAPTIPPSPLAFGGYASQSSAPFRLAAGDYRVEWSANSSIARDCILAASIAPVHSENGSPATRSVVTKTIPPSPAVSGSTLLHGVTGANYYLDVSTDACIWGIAITPQ